IEQLIDAAVAGEARLPGIDDHEADRNGDRHINETDEYQLRALAKRKARAQKCFKDRKEDERNREHLKQHDDEHAQLAEVLVAQTAHIRLLAERSAECRPADHCNDHLGVERQPGRVLCVVHTGLSLADEYRFLREKSPELGKWSADGLWLMVSS